MASTQTTFDFQPNPIQFAEVRWLTDRCPKCASLICRQLIDGKDAVSEREGHLFVNRCGSSECDYKRWDA